VIGTAAITPVIVALVTEMLTAVAPGARRGVGATANDDIEQCVRDILESNR
jgi:hypothetical protein